MLFMSFLWQQSQCEASRPGAATMSKRNLPLFSLFISFGFPLFSFSYHLPLLFFPSHLKVHSFILSWWLALFAALLVNFIFLESSSCISSAGGVGVHAGWWRTLNIDEEALAAVFYVKQNLLGAVGRRVTQLTNNIKWLNVDMSLTLI